MFRLITVSVGFKEWDFELPDPATWTIAHQIKDALDSVRLGRSEDTHGWNIPV